MADRKRDVRQIPQTRYGVSFSAKQCRNFGIDQFETLKWLIEEMGFRRFRLMSYWDKHEKVQGEYDFNDLDKQIAIIEKSGGVVTLCLGVRQPRWPESHWPKWALKLPLDQRYSELFRFMQIVIERYKNDSTIINYQLENEALNRSFGLNGDFNRNRILNEFNIIRRLDPSRKVIMSTSNSWGIPVRWPTPDLYGLSIYRKIYKNNHYTSSPLPVWFQKVRAAIISRPCFIHELQAEPWGPEGIWDLPLEEQDASMSTTQLRENIRYAKKTKLYPIDLWGGEWWYWRNIKYNDSSIASAVKESL